MIDNLIISFYLIGVLCLGLWVGRKTHSLTEYAVVKRAYPTFFVFATLSASFIGGGFSVGNAEKVYLFGIANIVALWGFSLKEILVAKFIAPRMVLFPNVISVGDIMERAYGKGGKLISGIFSVLLCAGIVGAQVGAMGYIFNVFTGIPALYGILIGCGIVILYSALGGMRAVVVTDVIQFLILSIGIPLTLAFGIWYVGGFSVLKTSLPPGHFKIISAQMPWTAFVSLFLTFLLGETLVPPYVQRLLIGKDAPTTARGTLLSGLFSIPFFAMTGGIGLIALSLNQQLDPNLSLPYVIKTVLPIGVKGFVVAGMISIVMSSADSFLNSAAVSFMNDIVLVLFHKKPPTEKNKLMLVKIITFFVGALAVVFAIKIKSILGILIYAYHFWAPIILVPLVAAILGVKAKLRDFIIAACAGIFGAVLWNKFLHAPYRIDGLVMGVVFNTGFFLISLNLRKTADGNR